MKIIATKQNFDTLKKNIRPVDDPTIMKLVKLAFQFKKSTDTEDIRNIIYVSKYQAVNLERKELNLERELDKLSKQNHNVRTNNQSKEYKWVKINTDRMGAISYRFYIAPKPENIHELVKKMVEEFLAKEVPVRFKYQLTTGMKSCDRIIIYSDFNNKKLVEEALQSVYQSSKELFDGCERSVAWLYNSSVPNVYFAPETEGDAYSNRFSDSLLEARMTFNFLYGITESGKKIKLFGKVAEQAIEYMKLLIPSIMFRKGIFLSKDGRLFHIKDNGIWVCYDYKTGILTHKNKDSRGYFEANFLPTQEGRKALLENFYNVSDVKQQPGVNVRYLTLEQHTEELNRFFHPELYNSTNNFLIQN